MHTVGMLRAFFSLNRRAAAGAATRFPALHKSPTSFFHTARSTRYAAPVVASFQDVCFGFGAKEILDDVNFSIREGSKVTIMGQNGAGKSSIIKLLSSEYYPESGDVRVGLGQSVAVAKQTMPVECRDLTVEDYFISQFQDIDQDELPEPHVMPAMIAGVLREVQLKAPLDRIIKSFSGGQQARLLLAAALITDPTILLLDEPTNNLDHEGIDHLTDLITYTDRTCLVISHDEDFLNSFTDSVLYLDMYAKAVESYNGDYLFVKKEIQKRMARENSANARLKKAAQAKKDQSNKFKDKGAGMRKVAKKMRQAAADMEADMVDVRKEDETLRKFDIPFRQLRDHGPLITIDKVSIRHPDTGEMVAVPLNRYGNPLELGKGDKLHVTGPNGIGKTTFLELITKGAAEGVSTLDGLKIGYYRQDFHNFDFNASVLACLLDASNGSHSEQDIRRTASFFMLKGDMVHQKVATLSEGQKALMSLACLMLERPNVLIMDEPTNHVNFRHLPRIAQAVKAFEGAVIIVSHNSHWMGDVGIANNKQQLDMGKALDTLAP